MRIWLRWVALVAWLAGGMACAQVLGMDEPCLHCPAAADHCFNDGVCVARESLCEEGRKPYEMFRECICRDEPEHCLEQCASWCGGEEVADQDCADCLHFAPTCPIERDDCAVPH